MPQKRGASMPFKVLGTVFVNDEVRTICCSRPARLAGIPSIFAQQVARLLSVAMNFRPRLLGLEDRCLLTTVTNLMNSGPGSLRQAIIDTPTGETVDFQDGLSGTITLTSAPLDGQQDPDHRGPGCLRHHCKRQPCPAGVRYSFAVHGGYLGLDHRQREWRRVNNHQFRHQRRLP